MKGAGEIVSAREKRAKMDAHRKAFNRAEVKNITLPFPYRRSHNNRVG